MSSGIERIRDPWWDNARFVSAALIVVLHTIGSIMAQHHALHAFNLATWAFRVPAFVMLAGVFSSAGPLGPRELRTLLQSIALPAVLFSLLFSLEAAWLGLGFALHTAQLPWTLWFLMSLFCWRLLLPLVVQLRYPLAITTLVALGVGYLDEFGLLFSASRTLVYLPLFYVGWRIGQGALHSWFTSARTLPAAVAGLVLTALGGWFLEDEIKGSWLSMRHPYAASDPLGLEWAWTFRLALLTGAVVLVLCLLRLIPRRRLPLFSALGAGGFTIYMVHPLVIMPVREWGWIARVNTPLEQLGLILYAWLLAMALGSRLVRRLVNPVLRPPVGWLFAKAPPRPAAVIPAQRHSSEEAQTGAKVN